ncbi:hypothetical protein [Amycolatopsis sp. NPDC058986]|uniref:hypothetical protein n=1 Tax=unclassified Amycolatopsis TaxID=2618356 RepID=UPI003671DD89
MRTNLNTSVLGRSGLLALTVALLTGVTACTSGGSSGTGTGTEAASAAAKPEVFGPAGYRGLAPGMAKEAALAAGKLAPAPTSTLDGCADFSYTGGPAPDPARIAAEEAAEKKSKELNKKADEAAGAGGSDGDTSAAGSARSAAKSAEVARLMADSALALAELAEKREARDKAFAASGGASFGKDGLRELGAPPDAKTAEGIGAGSSVDELKKAYDARGLKVGENKRYQLPIDGKPGWRYEFVTSPEGKVTAVSIISAAKCA